ncbi:MAG: hypothetical protein D6681_18275 [Calditrichaeota bacterium]|nr:MAG: hypothetical protein D6681_18275 [Calditrichota bacterium]
MTDASIEQYPPPTAETMLRIHRSAATMSTWLKFLGVLTIISGALTALTFVGIIVAWIPIWLGVLMFQAGERAQQLRFSQNWDYLAEMMEKLRTYFVIYGVVTIIALVFAVASAFFLWLFMEEFSRQIQELLII